MLINFSKHWLTSGLDGKMLVLPVIPWRPEHLAIVALKLLIPVQATRVTRAASETLKVHVLLHSAHQDLSTERIKKIFEVVWKAYISFWEVLFVSSPKRIHAAQIVVKRWNVAFQIKFLPLDPLLRGSWHRWDVSTLQWKEKRRPLHLTTESGASEHEEIF